MVKVKTRRPQRERAFGTIAFVEDKGGKLSIHCDIMEPDDAPEAVIDRIKAVLAGLTYVYERDTEEIDRLGEAYLAGLETGIDLTQKMAKKKDDEGGNGAKMGFHAKLN